MISRRRTRELLLQSLYARTESEAIFDRESFLSSFQKPEDDYLDEIYFTNLETAILSHEKELMSIVARLAPKFELSTMPVLHILILCISLSEILYLPVLEIPVTVSINEAIELAKKFSDDQGKGFVNGTLATFMKEKETLLASYPVTDFRLFTQD